MINLLPPDYKSDIVYARKNTALKNWVLLSCIGVIGIVLIIAAGHVFISRSTNTWQKQVTDTRAQLGAQKLDETQKQITDISDSIKLALAVLSREILFSKLLSQVGAAMPSGTKLQSLSINSTQGGIDLTAAATTYQTATQVQINLADPANKIFEKADIVNAACNDNTKDPTPYPCSVTIRALFAKDNAFQYVTSGATK
jgi:hypothetical protein